MKKWLLALFVLAVSLDLGLTFVQNYHLPFEGDLPTIVVPSIDYAPILKDPFGWGVLRHGAYYVGPNRFFLHGGMYWYFRHVPLWLQHFFSPITSAYVAMALSTTAMQALLLYVLGWYATGTRRLNSFRLWLAMVLMMPLFQSSGYHMQMGLVTRSIAFAWAYTLPLLLLLVLYWPLYRAVRWGQPLRLPWWQVVAMLLLAVVLALSGPLLPGTVAVLGAGLALHAAWPRWRAGQWSVAVWRWFPGQALLVWGWLGALCLYSLYIGSHNAENFAFHVSIAERYQLLPLGVFKVLTVRLGLPLLLLACLGNQWLLRRRVPPSAESQRLALLLRWVGWFALGYVLLLPLGGYRGYRPLLVRFDTILPIAIGLVGFYGASTAYLLGQLAGRARHWYVGGVLVLAAIFINSDLGYYPGDNNICERQALERLSHASPAPVVALPENCAVLNWEASGDPNESLLAATMLVHWRIMPRIQLFYHPGGRILPSDGANHSPANLAAK